MSTEKCPTCGSPVKIEGNTTKYYVPVNSQIPRLSAEREKEIGKMICIMVRED